MLTKLHAFAVFDRSDDFSLWHFFWEDAACDSSREAIKEAMASARPFLYPRRFAATSRQARRLLARIVQRESSSDDIRKNV